jgi:hypothetical protein
MPISETATLFFSVVGAVIATVAADKEVASSGNLDPEKAVIFCSPEHSRFLIQRLIGIGVRADFRAGRPGSDGQIA